MSDAAADPAPPAVGFVCYDRPGSYFYELVVQLGDRREEIGGSRVFGGPEDALMKAVLALIAGDWTAEAPFPAENDASTLTLRMYDPTNGVPRPNRIDYVCELTWSELDRDHRPIETRSLGIAPSVRQLADAVLAFGQAYYAGREPSAALVALGAAWPAIQAARPYF